MTKAEHEELLNSLREEISECIKRGEKAKAGIAAEILNLHFDDYQKKYSQVVAKISGKET
jgi:hypothetical protein